VVVGLHLVSTVRSKPVTTGADCSLSRNLFVLQYWRPPLPLYQPKRITAIDLLLLSNLEALYLEAKTLTESPHVAELLSIQSALPRGEL
jgi:hypothetical protein